MKMYGGLLGRLLVTMALCFILLPTSLAAATLQGDRVEVGMPGLDLLSIPSLGELTVGEKTYLLERVENGFIARDVESQRAAVITYGELAQFRFMAPNRSSDQGRFTIEGAQLFGGREALTVIVDEADEHSVSATIATEGTGIPVRYEARFASPDRSIPYPGSSEGLAYVNDEVVLVIIISAAVISAVGCTIAALLTNCASDCADACSVCGGSLLSSDEGLCGTCTCTCQRSGFNQEIPNGEGCGAY